MQKAFQVLAPLTLVVLLSGCATKPPATYIGLYGVNKEPKVAAFDACISFGCDDYIQTGYTQEEWDSVAEIFEPAPKSPEEERERIKIAIGAMEQIIGPKVGTGNDARMNDGHRGTVRTQIDCIAEAVNTTISLMLLEQEGVLRFHDVGNPEHRGPARFQYPHNSAAVVDTTSGEIYVIDSWFFAGGKPAISVPVERWRSGYSPYRDPDFPLEQYER